jgi:hypothetical protein
MASGVENEKEQLEKKITEYGFYEISKKYDLGKNMGIYNENVLTELKRGFIVEYDEHGDKEEKNKFVNVVKDVKERAMLIAISHLMEFPDYYTRLEKLENDAEDFWKTIESIRRGHTRALNNLAQKISSHLNLEEKKNLKLHKTLDSTISLLDATKKQEFLVKFNELMTSFSADKK